MSYFVTGEKNISGFNTDGIRGVVTYDSIAVYWQKPGETVEKYELYLDGVVFGETARTHYEFRELMPETSYTITIKVICGNAPGVKRDYDDRQGVDAAQGHELHCDS